MRDIPPRPAALLLAALLCMSGAAWSEEPGLEIALELRADGLPPLTQVTNAGDTRLFLVTQRGQVLLYDGGTVRSEPFLDIQEKVSCCFERGLLSIAFLPDYVQSGVFLVAYTALAGELRIERYRVSEDPNRADSSSGALVIEIAQPFETHNGGQLQFGPDGYLYIGTGDGGGVFDPFCMAQDDNSLLGKMLRIDVSSGITDPPYRIPPDNPFVGEGPPRDEIWAKGLRNPWRFSFDSENGDLWIADVGQGEREEINREPAGGPGGSNYGWKIMEGTLCGGAGAEACLDPAPLCGAEELIAPVYEYGHEDGDCSATGGYVYRGIRYPLLSGSYLHADHCSGRFRVGDHVLPTRLPRVTSFGEDMEGELYVVTGGSGAGRLYRLSTVSANGPRAPVEPTTRPALPPRPVGGR